jgi:uncharacterized iron-regulated membrane protein
MITPGQAAFLGLIVAICAGVLGVGAGGLMCWIRRRRWTFKGALIDGVLAALVYVIAAEGLGSLEFALGNTWPEPLGPALVLAVISVVVRRSIPPRKSTS